LKKNLFPKIKIIICKEYIIEKQYHFSHGHQKLKPGISCYFSGHYHPKVKLSNAGVVNNYNCILVMKSKDSIFVNIPSISVYKSGYSAKRIFLEYEKYGIIEEKYFAYDQENNNWFEGKILDLEI
jgi:metallophosphoesterase superfamily enzyme